ncbi:MAG TPA: ATP-binding protein [Verrucomicrobiae bacterium]|nr:ATP-binding protein [Verrucomicrobiae bacterium]
MSAAAEFSWMPQDARTELRVLFEHATVGLAELRQPGDLVVLNAALGEMLGDASAMETIPFLDLVPAEQRAEAERCLRELLDGERDEFQLDSVGGVSTERSLRWRMWRVAGSPKHRDYALALAEDATDARFEKRLQQAERLEAVGRLAGGVAHDFNNLLTGVLLYCDLLLATLDPQHRGSKYTREIRNAVLQATGLVRQLLAVARPRSSEPRLLSLNETVDSMRDLLTRLIGENIELRFQLDGELGLVKMDPTQAQQILLNLVLNARDAMPDGGEISVETNNCRVQVLSGSNSAEVPSVSCAMFAVQDGGRGIDAETRAHLFEAFFTTKSAGKGTGLGLATVYDIVKSNGGLIHVDSSPGRGTRITILLPLVPTEVLKYKPSHDSQSDWNEKVRVPDKE